MKKRFEGRLEIEELEARIAPSAIFGAFLPVCEISADGGSQAVAEAHGSNFVPHDVSGAIFDTSSDFIVGAEHFGLNMKFAKGAAAFDTPDGLDFAPSAIGGHADVEVPHVPMVDGLASVVSLDMAEAQVEILAAEAVRLSLAESHWAIEV